MDHLQLCPQNLRRFVWRQAVIFKLRPPFFKKEINIKKKSKMTSKLDENEKWWQKIKIEKKGKNGHFSREKWRNNNNSNKTK